MTLAPLAEAIRDYRAGKFVIIVDDEDRENEGDLCLAAERVTPEAINFMATHGRGLICAPMTGERLDALRLPPMVYDNTSPFRTAFTVSVEARRGVSTGISAADRAATVRALIDPGTGPDDLVRPGHMFPLRYQPGGVLVRAGQTEASVDLAVLAGMYPAAVICEVMAEDGTMMRLPQLEAFAARHGLKIISVAQLIKHRAAIEKLVARTVEARLPTRYGDFTVYAYRSVTEHEPHLALALGDLAAGGPVLARVHSECLTGDIFGSLRCDCGEQLDLALRLVAAEGRGVVLYMRQEGRGIGLHNKLRAYQLQDEGLDTVEANERLGFAADLRHYGIGAQILVDLGVRELRLLTNNPKKVVGLEGGYGLRVVQQVPLVVPANPENARYLHTKQAKLGHRLPYQPEDWAPRNGDNGNGGAPSHRGGSPRSLGEG